MRLSDGPSGTPRRQRLYREERQARIYSAQARQPPRADHRRDRHRQDRDPAGAGRRLLRSRRAGVLRRREGRPFRHRREGRAQALDRGARQGDRLHAGVPRLSGDLLGPVRQAGPPDPDHRLGHGAAAAVAPHGSERRAGGRAQYRLQDRRRRGPAADHSQEPADLARGPGGARRHAHHEIRQHHQGVGRLDPALAARARAAGRRAFLRQAGRSTSRT